VLALLFPGQGSQFVGMGRDVAEASDAAREVFRRADEVLGYSISKLCFEGPEDELRLTRNQQPALLTTSIALLRALEEQGPVEAAYLAGHSLGEYSALVAAGAMPLADAVRVVNLRGQFMQEAVPEGSGAMAAILGSDPEAVSEACAAVASETCQVVTPANFNSRAQTVIAGATAAVELAGARCKEAGAKKVVALPVSAPFHCSLMAPAATRLRPELDAVDFAAPSAPIISNVDAEPNSDPGRIAGLLEQQVTAPVRFSEMVERLLALGTTHFLEVGPGKVLTSLVARIQRRVKRANLGEFSDLEDVRAFLADV
jgi:[acyl-carrier-protein] S-malonyltransferase